MVLDAAGYDARSIGHALRPAHAVPDASSPLVDRRDLPVYRRRLGERADALAVLIRLFLFSDAVDAGIAEHALGDLDVLVETGLVAERGGQIEPLARVVPHDDLVLVSDCDESGAGWSHVPGVHRPSATLAHLTLRHGVMQSLDMGTGLGIQALLLARHSQRVVATDVNERALAFASFNAALNGVTNVEFRQGSFFEPVAGERFDLVVCNPPYVISPASEFVFRDGTLARDGVSELVVRSLPGVLAPEGVATAMISWIVDGDDVGGRPRSWLEGADCDALLLHSVSDDALTTASEWNRDLRRDPDAYAERIDEWMDFFAAEGIERIAYGALVLRRRSGVSGSWRAELRLPEGALSPASTHLERILAANDVLADGLADRVLDATVGLAPGVRVDVSHRLADGAWLATAPEVCVTDGIGFRVRLDEATLEVVRRLDGSTTLREAVDRASLDLPPHEARRCGAELACRLLHLGLATWSCRLGTGAPDGRANGRSRTARSGTPPGVSRCGPGAGSAEPAGPAGRAASGRASAPRASPPHAP